MPNTRNEKVSTSVTAEEKQAFRMLSAMKDEQMAETLRGLVYDELEKHGYTTSRQSGGGPSSGTGRGLPDSIAEETLDRPDRDDDEGSDDFGDATDSAEQGQWSVQ